MEDGKAKALVAMLIAAYPQQGMEPATVEVYSAAIAELERADLARDVIGMFVRSSPKLPAISEIRHAYIGLLATHANAPALGWKAAKPDPGSVADRQLAALKRARERIPALDAAVAPKRELSPIGVVMLQWQELEAADVPVWMNGEHMPDIGPGCLDPRDRVTIRQRFPDWRVGQDIPERAYQTKRVGSRAFDVGAFTLGGVTVTSSD